MNIGYSSDSSSAVVWTTLLDERSAWNSLSDSWSTVVDPESLSEFGREKSAEFRIISRSFDGWTLGLIATWKDRVLARINFTSTSNSVGVNLASASVDDLKLAMSRIKELMPTYEPVNTQISVCFWTLGPDGPEQHWRSLDAPAWDDIHVNYATSTQNQIEQLISHPLSPTEGKLILWHGVPGTGKTFAIRALAQEWKTQAEVHYILDPEQFFDAKAAYMIRVLLSPTPKWKLLVLEDSGEFLAKDAKAHQGQGMSRLLNVCDGMIGQGLKLLILITTNEDLGSFHQAVTRPGRCLAKTEFMSLDHGAVLNWAAKNNRYYDGEVPASLADLYVGSQQIKSTTSNRKVGFQR